MLLEVLLLVQLLVKANLLNQLFQKIWSCLLPLILQERLRPYLVLMTMMP